MRATDFTGTGTLFALFLRRDRFFLPVWVLIPVLLLMLNAATFIAMDSRTQGLEITLAQFNDDPLITTVLGPVMSITLSGAIVWRTISLLTLALGLGNIFSVIRHSRMDEETGRGELLRAYVVGRHAALTAALSLSLLGNLVAGGMIALSMIVLGGEPTGSTLFGATISAVGCFFAGIGALGVQLRETSGSARGIGVTVLGIGILMAIMNNAGGGQTILRWMTPMAWQRVIRPFAGNHGWLLLYCIAFCAVPVIIAYSLSPLRDLGTGLLVSRSGPSETSPRFATPLALAWRLQRKTFFGWLIGTTLYIVVFSGISPALSRAGGVSEWLMNLGGTEWTTEAGLGYIFISIGIYLISLIVAVFAMGAVLRLKKEETEGRTEMLLDKRIGRVHWMNSHLIVAALGSASLLLAMGIVGGLIYGLVAGDLVHEFRPIFIMSVSKIPAVWTLLGLTALLYGVFPRITSLVWPAWLTFTLLEVAWETQVVDWSIMRFSPFSVAHYTISISNLPLRELILLIFLSASLTGIGLLGFRTRDILIKA